MEIHQPLKRDSGPWRDRWDYTVKNSSGVYPIGYCHFYVGPVNTEAIQWSDEERDKVVMNQRKYHGDGHATSEDAIRCYHQYLVDQRTKFVRRTREEVSELRRCHGTPLVYCDNFTANVAMVDGYHSYPLCDEHLDEDVLLKILDKISGL